MKKILIAAAAALSLLGVTEAANAATFYGHGPRGNVVVHTNFHGSRHVWVRGERFVPYRGIVAINDWRGFGLARPYRGAHWVNAGSDFLLISNMTGRILQVVPRY